MTTTDILPFASAGNGAPLTMSSRDIADLTEKEHKNVLRDIRVMLVELYGAPGDTFEDLLTDGSDLSHLVKSITCEKDTRGYVSVIHLDKEHTITLVAGYDVRLRKRIVDRWLELERMPAQSPALPDFTNPAVAARAWADEVERRMISDQRAKEAEVSAHQSAAQLAAVAPKAEALKRIEAADGSMCLMDAAKTLKKRPIDLTRFMDGRHWIYKRPGNKSWIGYHDKIAAGLLEHSDHVYIDSQGRERVATQVKVTAKGLVRLAELLNEKPH